MSEPSAVTPISSAKRTKPLRETLQEIIERDGLGPKEIADQSGVSSTVVREVLADRYSHDGRAIRAIENWLLRYEGSADFVFVEGLKNTLQVMKACSIALEDSCLVGVVGEPGVGKTTGFEAWVKKQVRAGEEVVYHHVAPWITHGALARTLCRRFGVPERGTAYDQLLAIAERLRGKPAMIIFDEANRLNLKCLDGIRFLYDSAHCPIVLGGSEELKHTLIDGGRARINLQTLQSRIPVMVELQPASQLDTNRLLAAHFAELEPEVQAAFHKESRGIARYLWWGIKNTKKVMEANKLEAPTVEAVKRAFAYLLRHRLIPA